MKAVGIKFKEDGKVYNFYGTDKYEVGQKVIVNTERGEQLGIIDNIFETNNIQNLKEIVSIATEKDYDKYLKNLKEAEKALEEAKKMAKNQNLNMNFIDASFSLDKKQLLFNFVSEERVDFRNLVKELASKYHTRIELRQIGIRDKAKAIGGIGPCGRELCCSLYMKNMNSVNINMVKNQNIALNPTKINGACGRLLCCFNYENDLYEENRQILPKIGEKIKYKNELCEVIDIDILKKKIKIKLSNNDFEEVIYDGKE